MCDVQMYVRMYAYSTMVKITRHAYFQSLLLQFCTSDNESFTPSTVVRFS